MSDKPIFVATHPRACSTAFERVFMTRRDTLTCVHEPFGDAFYYGPERLSTRYENDEKQRMESGFSSSTFQTILDRFERESAEGKRLFIKDITYYLVPPDGKPATIAPSLARKERGVGTDMSSSEGVRPNSTSAEGRIGGSMNGNRNSHTASPYPYHTDAEPENPTVIPKAVLEKFHFTFLIRHPRSSIPSYFRCTIPPLDSMTGFYDFMPSEAGYNELRRFFDYLRSVGQVGPGIAGKETDNPGADGSAVANGHSSKVDICVVDADDLLDNPSGIIEAYCQSVGLKYDPKMLNWDSEEDHNQAREAFEKWKGFHEDAMDSVELRPRLHKKKVKSVEEEDQEWRAKYGEKGARVIRETVDANIKDYEYLKHFALKV